MANILNAGIQLRWFNTAGFEMVLPGGAHLLVDPWLDSSDLYPFPLEKVERADYILLSHVHFDHAQDIERVLAKFPKAKLFIGDLSIDALCKVQHVSLTNIYRVRNGDEYTFDDVNIKVYGGRHTENSKGAYRPEQFDSDQSSLNSLTGYYGSMELQNYLITAADGTKVLVWGGQTTADQKYRLRQLYPDVALMHLSPKQDPYVFAQTISFILPKVVIPHHYDLTKPLFDGNPKLMDLMLSPEAKAKYVVDGEFNYSAFVGAYADKIAEVCPAVHMMEIEHHKWYRFGLAVESV